MYRYCETDDSFITLHDCKAERLAFNNGILSFFFSDGFWILENHPKNNLKKTVKTDKAQVDFQITDEEIDGISIYIFKKSRRNKIIREEWEADNFIKAVNDGSFKIEFITQYKGFQSVLFKCWVWFNVKPYHMECEIILNTNKIEYMWNNLRKDRVW